MALGEIHISDVGTTIRAIVRDSATTIDLSTATFTSMYFVFRSPGGTANTQAATAFGSASTGIVDYTVTSNTLFNTSGLWQIQAITTVGTNKWSSDILNFIVHPNL